MLETGWSEWLSMMTSLVVVIALLAITLFSLKKLGLSNSKSTANSLHIIQMHNLGPRQRLILVSINGEQLLLGATPQAINCLGNWSDDQVQTASSLGGAQTEAEQPKEGQAGEVPPADGPGKFQQLLKQIHDRKKT